MNFHCIHRSIFISYIRNQTVLCSKIRSMFSGTYFLSAENVKLSDLWDPSLSKNDLQKIISDIVYEARKGTVSREIVIDFLGLSDGKRYRRVFSAFFFFLHFDAIDWRVVPQTDLQEVGILMDISDSWNIDQISSFVNEYPLSVFVFLTSSEIWNGCQQVNALMR